MKTKLTLIALSLFAAVTVYASPPICLEKPVVGGNNIVSRLMYCTTGTWDGSYTYSYQWFYFDTAFGGEAEMTGYTTWIITVPSYVCGYGIRCKVTAVNGMGQHTVQGSSKTVDSEVGAECQ